MAWVTPTNVATGDVLTASKWNQDVVENSITLPQGIIGYHSLESTFSTSATHTTFQDEGLSASVTYGANRLFLVTLCVRPYPNGGLQAVQYRVLRGATQVCQWIVESVCLSAGAAGHFMLSQYAVGPATGATETWKVQIKASSVNTQVTSWASAAEGPRQLIIEDCGAV